MTSLCIDHAAQTTGVSRSQITATMILRGPGVRATYAMNVGGQAFACEVSGAPAILAFTPEGSASNQ